MGDVVLHIGLHKTGTTSIQYWLRDHEELLARFGVHFPRGYLRLNNHFELPLTLLRRDRMMNGRLRADEWRSPTWCAELLAQVDDDLAAHPSETTILSAEDLSLFRYDDEWAPLRALVGNAHVVVYLRERADFLASMAAHYCKPGMAGLSDDPEAYNYLAPDSWRADYDTLLAGWRRHFSRVTVLDYDDTVAREGSVVPSFLRLLGVECAFDTDEYWLNARRDAIPRAEGNRLTTGAPFGS